LPLVLMPVQDASVRTLKLSLAFATFIAQLFVP
jgi:hypothetical protein